MTLNLSSSEGILCWDNKSDADNAAGMIKMAVNDTAERYFSTMIGQIQYYGKIVLITAVGVSEVRLNGNLSRGFDTSCKNKNTKRVQLIFHKISEKIRVSLP